MQRFKNILLVVDGQSREHATRERAATLAKSNNARLTAISVIKGLPRDMQMLIRVMTPAELQELVIKERSRDLEQFIAPIQQQGIRVTSKVLLGTHFLEIIKEVLRNECDLVMMTTEEKPGVREMLFGTTSMHLMRKCPCPVWVMKPTQRRRYAGILAAVDVDPEGEEKTKLNSMIMELAISLAHLERSELHVVHAWEWDTFAESIITQRAGFSQNEINVLLKKTKKRHETWLYDLLGEFTFENLEHQVHLLKGGAGVVIPQLAIRKRVELIVMGTVSRTGVRGLLIGNTAEKVLHQVDCSVLAVKPDGFVTPVILDE